MLRCSLSSGASGNAILFALVSIRYQRQGSVAHIADAKDRNMLLAFTPVEVFAPLPSTI